MLNSRRRPGICWRCRRSEIEPREEFDFIFFMSDSESSSSNESTTPTDSTSLETPRPIIDVQAPISKSHLTLLKTECDAIFTRHAVPFELRDLILDFAFQRCTYCFRVYHSTVVYASWECGAPICVMCDERVWRIYEAGW
jgi:hypothetical protein